MPDLISIDWDFFTLNRWHETVDTPTNGPMPGMLVYDWLMSEARSADFSNLLWETRALSLRLFGLDPVEATRIMLPVDEFAYQIGMRWPLSEAPTWAADSHSWIGPVIHRLTEDAGGPLTVFNFDAHHDLSYGSDAEEKFNDDLIQCDDWAYWGLRTGKIENFIQVYPDWLGRAEWKNVKRPHLKDYKSRIDILTWSEFLATYQDVRDPENVAGHFICRSSSWTPPWQDHEFQNLLDEFGWADCLDCLGERQGVVKNYDVCDHRDWDWGNVDEHDERRKAVLKLADDHA